MDGLSAEANIVALLQLSNGILGIVRASAFSPATDGYRREVEVLQDELESLNSVLEILSNLPSIPGSSKLAKLLSLRGPIEACLRELQSLMDKLSLLAGSDRAFKRMIKSLVTKEELRRIISSLEKSRATFALALSSHQM